MLTLFLSFIKNKLFSSGGIFLLIFGAIFTVFLFSNSNVVLSKFGFETTTTLKAQLVKAQADLVTLKTVNDELTVTVTQLNDSHKRDIKAISDLQSGKNISTEAVSKITTKKIKIQNSVSGSLDNNTTYTLTTVTLPLKEVNQLSANNIDSLNETYNTLFGNNSHTTSDTKISNTDFSFQNNEVAVC